jgi:hypothetical protein
MVKNDKKASASLQGIWYEFNRGEITFTGNNFVWEWDSAYLNKGNGRGSFTAKGNIISLNYDGRVITYKFTVSPDSRMLTLYDTKNEKDFTAFSKR